MDLSLNFKLEEFERVSHRSLSKREEARAKKLVRTLLQPLRREFGPIRITSFVRTGTAIGGGAHADGGAVDFVLDDFTKLEAAFEWLATYKTGHFGELIFERDHIHITLPGIGGESEVLREPEEGIYKLS